MYSGQRKNLDCHRKNSDCHNKNPDCQTKNLDFFNLKFSKNNKIKCFNIISFFHSIADKFQFYYSCYSNKSADFF